jgi:hypothetical protein
MVDIIGSQSTVNIHLFLALTPTTVASTAVTLILKEIAV